MQKYLRQKVTDRFDQPVNSPRDCNLLSEKIFKHTRRNISPSTLRRFFGMLPSKSALSTYNLDTLAIFCGSRDYKSFESDYNIVENAREMPLSGILQDMQEITNYTIRSVSRKSLSDYRITIPRNEFNKKLNSFLESGFFLMPVIAPGGYGKSIALTHWIDQLDHENIFCLFCPAVLFMSLVNTDNPAHGRINLNPGSPGSIYQVFIKYKEKINGKLVIIIDALEELKMDDPKNQQFTDIISETLTCFKPVVNLKIILSTRETTWNLLKSSFKSILGKGFIINEKHKLETGYTNFPQLSGSELNEIILNYNNHWNRPLIYDCINFEIKEKIRIPIYLHYYMNLSREKKKQSDITANHLEQEYLREKVFESNYAEQKEDLLWKILELIQAQSGELKIQKNDLKESYPIHMKRETWYYQAFRELLNDILIEERFENKYGLFSTFISFRHLNFYYYLSALYLIRRNGGINKNIFQHISSASCSTECKIHIISVLYQFSWEDENTGALLEFCKLPLKILDSLQVRIAVGTSFRMKNNVFNKIIKHYAKVPSFQKFYFEEFVDTNYLFNNYKFRISEYLKNKKTKEAKLFGNCILFLAGFLKMNKNECLKYYGEIKKIDAHPSVHPWPIGRKLAVTILVDYFIQKEFINSISSFTEHLRKIAYQHPGYFEQGVIAFEMPVIISLVLTKKYTLMASFLEISRDTYSFQDQKNEYYKLLFITQNSLLYIFLDFALMKKGEFNNQDLIPRIEETINNFNTYYDDFQYLILLRYLLIDIYSSENQFKKANQHFQAALELSKYAGYDLFTAFLLLHDPEKESGNIETAKKMFEESGFRLPEGFETK